MGKYKQRADGRFATSIVINGKKKTIYANTSAELNKKIVDLKYKNLNNIVINDEDITMGQFTQKWYEINSVGKTPGTIGNYKNIINNYINPYLGNIKLSKLKPYDIQAVANDLISNNHAFTAKRYLTYVKRILNEAIQNDIIVKNPASSIKLPAHKSVEKFPLSEQEDKLLIKYASKHKHGLLFLLVRFTGLRKEEVAALTIKDIDFNKNTISINKAISFSNDNQGTLKETKNKKSRNVYILNIFKNQLKERVDYCKKNNIEWLFTKQTNEYERLSNIAIKRALQSFILFINTNENTHISFTLHQLRHSYCTMLYYSGIGIKEAQNLMGHSSADMVYDIYTHLDMEKGMPYEKLTEYTKKYE